MALPNKIPTAIEAIDLVAQARAHRAHRAHRANAIENAILDIIDKSHGADQSDIQGMVGALALKIVRGQF